MSSYLDTLLFRNWTCSGCVIIVFYFEKASK